MQLPSSLHFCIIVHNPFCISQTPRFELTFKQLNRPRLLLSGSWSHAPWEQLRLLFEGGDYSKGASNRRNTPVWISSPPPLSLPSRSGAYFTLPMTANNYYQRCDFSWTFEYHSWAPWRGFSRALFFRTSRGMTESFVDVRVETTTSDSSDSFTFDSVTYHFSVLYLKPSRSKTECLVYS